MVILSRARGKDAHGCGVRSKPCYSIPYALQQATEGSTIYLDGTETESSPYTCESFNTKRPRISLEKSVSFVGIKSRAHISCNHGASWFVNGDGNKNNFEVVFKNLAFHNTSIKLRDVSVHMQDCVYDGTEKTAIKISLVKQTRFHLTLDNVVFEHNKACLLLTSKTNHQNEILLTINNSVIKSNGLRSVDGFTGQKSIFSINGNNDTMKIVINKTSFTGNNFQTESTNEKSIDLIHIKNKFGKCSVSVEHSHFKDNGFHGSTFETNLFSITSSYLSAAIRRSQIVNSKSARFLYFTGESSYVPVHHTEFRNYSKSKKHFHNGGILSIKACQMFHLFIKDCCITKGKLTTDLNGGVAYVDASNVKIAIQSSFVDGVSTNGMGGVFYIKEVDKTQHLVKSQLIFYTSDSKFYCNKARDRGGVLFASSRDITTVTFDNVTFEKNVAFDGKGGAINVEILSHGSTIVLNRSVFKRNTAKGSYGGVPDLTAYGGAMFLSVSCSTISFINTTFENNKCYANQGGAL